MTANNQLEESLCRTGEVHSFTIQWNPTPFLNHPSLMHITIDQYPLARRYSNSVNEYSFPPPNGFSFFKGHSSSATLAILATCFFVLFQYVAAFASGLLLTGRFSARPRKVPQICQAILLQITTVIILSRSYMYREEFTFCRMLTLFDRKDFFAAGGVITRTLQLISCEPLP